MIDFRYHVVSLVSVFIALAVGIVLGAGPLNEGISVGITDQVNQLTSEKNQLRTERDQALQASDAKDDWATAVGPALVARQLSGRAVAVIELPGADGSQADATVTQLQAAGATVPARVTLQDKWFDPQQAAFRNQLAAQLLPELTDAPAAGAATETQLAAELARALVTNEAVTGAEADPTAAAIVAAMTDAGLLSVDGTLGQRGTLAVLVGGAPDGDATDQEKKATAAGWLALAAQLDQRSAGAVLAGSAEAADGGPVAAVRGSSDVSDDVSTVDGLDSVIGQIDVVLALRQQLAGAAGQYGTASGATAVSPPLPAAVP
ncbi:copper transporter [Kineococcus rubinsiae]|uniref:copper transporter n=1 Tax=Kineococcus rubinsiae TaxID=2609562 RepID=UPI0014300310|nr:copper transporter [Kineococcus rubinsiae]NIZ93676.1 copper transporter [Kineococcus rubinsiae]